ncbi:GNAT family N-acetyltransferase [Cyclobacterium sp.]|uniref:GNAT family N-acetyltransferase n=1 Tax=Cyclobacterium sp. TaxID=1966343 RepID=UPI0019A36796|nr:GNAT family N-acetyltransferase [Cyclobacterium sp.]MBD3627337.1 GNAT family N-acetyltransferase [Cyclobacterium sp.]
MDSEIYLRTMQQEDLPAVMDLKTAEGWNQTQTDWELFLTHHPDLCLVARLEEKTVGTVSAFAFENKLAWIGMMLVHRQFRRKGISKRLMREVIHRLNFCQTIKLDATPAGQAVYEKLGFKKEYSLFRWIRKTGGALTNSDLSPSVYKLDSSGFNEILPFDAAVFGADREVVLRHIWTSFPGGAYLFREQGIVKGFLLSRKGSNYLQLGPLIAENEAVARALLQQAMIQWGGRELVLDMAANRPEMNAWLEQEGFRIQRELIRMYLHTNSSAGMPEKYYLIAGPEFG